MSSRVPPRLRGRVHSLGLVRLHRPHTDGLRAHGPVSKAIGTDTTLVLAGVLPIVVGATLYVLAGLRRDEERHPLLGEDYAGAGASSADSGSGTPAIS
jgi:hypothetical protein